MIAPALERAPRMLLVIGKDEQGLPTETIILEPSVSQLYASLRAWLDSVLPNWLHRTLDPTRRSHAAPLAGCEQALIDVQLRWAGL
jgi:hypothetical protein